MSWNEAEGECKDYIHSISSLTASPLAPLSVPNQKPASQAKLLDAQLGLFLRKTGHVSVCYLCSALGMAACQELSLQLLQSHGTQEHKAPPVSRARQSRGVLWMIATKTRLPDTKTRAPNMCRSFPSGVTGTLVCFRRTVQKWHPLKKRKKKRWLPLSSV